MTYNVSKVTNDLIVAINDLLDDVQQLIDDRFFQIGLNMKVAETLLKPVYSKVESLADELVLEGGAGEVVSEDIQKLVDDALLESVKSANVDSSDEETIKMLELMKIETEPSNLPAEINLNTSNFKMRLLQLIIFVNLLEALRLLLSSRSSLKSRMTQF